MINEFLTYYTSKWASDLQAEKTFGIQNGISMAFSHIDRFGETLYAIISNMKGNSGKGSGFDLSNGTDAAEVKTVCLCQPWKCKDCSKSTPWVSTECVHCKSKNLKRMNDTRFGISAAAHIKHCDVLKTYYLVAIDYVEADLYSVHVWKLDSCNSYFEAYVKNQNENGKGKTCNMLPRSYDFYMSGPKLVYQINFWLEDETSFETINHDIVEDVPVQLLDDSEKALFPEFTNKIPYNVALERLSLRKKSLGKNRGETTRRL